MGNYGDDRHGGGDRWRDRGQGYGDRDDRGFIDRAGDEVRSWFGDDEAQRRREADQRRWEQEQRMSGRRDNDSGPGTLGGGGFGTGWGNQEGRSWNRERPGERGGSGAYGGRDEERGGAGGERRYARGEREGWFTDSEGGERGRREGGSGGGGYGSGYGNESGEFFRGSGFGGDYERGRRFDRVDAGSTGTHGAHPMSAPVSGGFGGDYGPQGSGDSAREAAILREQGGSGHRDPHYSEWRRRQIEDLDRDYDEYRREHQSKFEAEFGSWRSKRQGQRQSLGRVAEHMEVVGSDGSHVGTVDKVRGDRILLTKSDPAAGGAHHMVPCSWVERVDDKVVLNKSAEEALGEWRNEERSGALFERDGEGGEGPRNLDRAFSGTYEGREGERDEREE
ncbi:MAG: hypothetical protein QOE79_2336 [Sphingomonadales bacterium]|jgi:hypothetical protein|nr:hypothetical protein [Sphingomonadales bacterium]